MKKLIVTGVLCLCAPWVAAKDVYIWVDEYGERHFSDQKPKHKSADELEVRNVGKQPNPADVIDAESVGADELTLPFNPVGGARSSENLLQTFDRYKERLFSIYQQALEVDPELRGKVRFKLTITPSGQVKRCHILSTGLHNDELNLALKTAVMGFDFGAQPVKSTTTKWAVSFMP